MSNLNYDVNTLAADDLVMQGVGTSAAMACGIYQFPWNILGSVELTLQVFWFSYFKTFCSIYCRIMESCLWNDILIGLSVVGAESVTLGVASVIPH